MEEVNSILLLMYYPIIILFYYFLNEYIADKLWSKIITNAIK